MKSKDNAKKPNAELEARPSPGVEIATGRPGPAEANLLEAMLEAIATLELDGTICYVNSEFEKGSGWKREELIGKKIFDIGLIPKKEVEKIGNELIPKLMTQGSVRNFETISIRKDGTSFPVLMSWTLIKDNNGKPKNIITVARDITEHKRAEEQAKQLQGNLQLHIDRMPIGLIVWDTKFRVQTWNPAAEKIFGFTAEEALGKHPYNIIVPKEAQPQVDDIFHRLLEDDMTASIVNENITKDGRTIICDWANTPLKGANGKVTGILSMVQDITERRQVEEALRMSEEKIQSIFRAAPTGIGVVSNRIILQVNQKLCEITGYSEGELIGKNARILYPTEQEYEYVGKEKYALIRKSGTGTVETHWKHKDGRIIDILLSSTPIDKDNLSKGVTFTALDITERKLTEEKLRHAAEEWRTTFDSISDLVSVQDRDYRFLRVNKAFAHKFGMKPKEIIGKTCYEVVHGTSEPPPYCPNIAVLKTRKAATAEYYDLKSGLYLLESVWPILDDKGEVAISIHVARDITERKKAEVVLKKSERNFRNSIDNSPLGVSIITRDGKLVYANRAFLNLYGYKSVAELKSVPLSKRYTPESYKRRLERQEMGKRSLPIPKSYEISIIRKDGEIRNLQVTWENVFWDGQPRVQVLYQDITERRKMQEQLIIRDRLASVGELAAGVAHELNNPLTGVIGFSQLLLEKDIPADIREDVDIIYREARRSAEVVKNLLTFARKHVPQKRLLCLNSVIEKVLQLRAYEQRVTNITVVNRLDPNLPQAMGDEFQLQQVFLNIILNAEFSMIEASNGGTLTVTTEKVNGAVRASITDDGPGISQQALGHLFDPFFTTKEVGKGTGLGLSICHGIITEHGGRVYVESPPGKGATFIVELPLTRKAQKGKERLRKLTA